MDILFVLDIFSKVQNGVPNAASGTLDLISHHIIIFAVSMTSILVILKHLMKLV